MSKIDLECLKNLFKKPFTGRYPYEKIKPSKKFRGKIRFISEKCIGCQLCEKNCPSKAIKFYEKGKIDFDMSECFFCGLCVDICATDAIVFEGDFEYSGKNKKKFIVK